MPLPVDVLRIRLRNEIEMCQRELRHHISISDPSLSSFPVMVSVTFMRVPGPDWEEGKVVHRFVHRMAIVISEDYPMEKPIVKWQTPIFHPNIMAPSDGGYVCTKLLENWDFGSNLMTFIKGIESLLVNPNPANPFGNDLCTRGGIFQSEQVPAPPSDGPDGQEDQDHW
jgi:ubiquitin-conjugating enzyme E2 C